MTKLTGADYQRLLDVVGRLGGCADLEELRHQAVESIPTLVRSERTAWNELDLATSSVAQLTEPPVTIPDSERIFTETASSHPVLQHHIRTGDGRPRAISDFLSVEEFHATPIYERFYRLLDAEDQIAFQLPKADTHVAVALNRSRRGFSARDRELLNRLRPHLATAHRTVATHERLRRALSATELQLEKHAEGVIVVEPDGAVEHVSGVAAAILDRALPDGRRRADALRAAAGAELDELRSVFEPEATVELGRLDGGTIALLVRRRPPVIDLASILGRMGLTAREAQVLEMAARGERNAAIAADLTISIRTVETHMHHALDKLGVGNRTEAAALVHRLATEGV